MIKKRKIFTAKYFTDLKALYGATDGQKDGTDKNIQVKRSNDDRSGRAGVLNKISTPKTD